MANCKNRNSRSKFGLACGRHSQTHKQKHRHEVLQRAQKLHGVFDKLNKKKLPPYQLVRKRNYNSSGNTVMRYIIRRLPLLRLGKAKLLSLGENNLKFVIKRPVLTGNRIMNLDILKDSVTDITKHVCLCPLAQTLARDGHSPVTLHSEIIKSGLFSVILAVCQGYHQTFRISNSSKHASGYYDINIRAVWGTVTCGRGASHLNETLGTLNIPQMHGTMSTDIESQIRKWWLQILGEEMKKAGDEERNLAVNRGDFHQDVPAITVICDGGWSKRTHKHTYNALGGVGVIFGAETKKLLHIGVRNKQCVICMSASNNNLDPKEHECFKNWSESSQAMESDVILDGFQKAEQVHGVRYMRVIADGDSSVYSKLVENIPVWGGHIKKLECANHTCKCVRANVEKLIQEKPHFKGKGKLSGRNIVRLTTAVRCAIRMRSKDKNTKLLKHDIKNSIYHILGFHSHCSDFCKSSSEKTNLSEEESTSNTLEHTELSEMSVDEIFNDQSEYWQLPSDIEIEESRVAGKTSVSTDELQEIVRDMSVILGRVADKAERLIGNFTTNLAESWMSIRAKFDGGKTVNRCSRGSWNTRCYGGALRKNLGPSWSPIAFEKATENKPGPHFFSAARCTVRKHQVCEKYRSTEKYRISRRKRKLQSVSANSSKKAKLDYWSPLDDSEDIPETQLKELCQTFFEKKVKKTENEIMQIEKSTRDQSRSELWRSERRYRLTSSNFGKIISRRPTNISTCLVKNRLYNKFKGNINTIRGLAQEEHTKIEYKNIKANVTIANVGLVISKAYPFLPASPDGLVKEEIEEGLIEIKNFLQNNKYSIREAVKKVPNFCLEEDQYQKLRLKKNMKFTIKFKFKSYVTTQRLRSCRKSLKTPETTTTTNKSQCTSHVVDHTCTQGRISKTIETGASTSKSQFKSYVTTQRLRSCRKSLKTPETTTTTNKSQCTSHVVDHTCTQGRISKTIETGASTSKSQFTSGTVNQTSNRVIQTGESAASSVSVQKCSAEKKQTAKKKVLFLGTKIKHQWKTNDGKSEWYQGRVVRLIKGNDGTARAVYEVKYDGDEECYEIRNLSKDFKDGSLLFIDD